MEVKTLLRELSEATGVSGYEAELRQIVMRECKRYSDEVRVGKLGSVIALKKGTGGRWSLMLAAHMDEIGLIVSQIEKGFLRFTSVGGYDQRILMGQEVVVHGLKELPGIIASRPPHVLPAAEREKIVDMDQLFSDVGLTPEEIKELVRVGDVVTIKGRFRELGEDRLAGKALDDRAGVAAILDALRRLAGSEHLWDAYFVATVQEEVGLRGAITSAYGIRPDIAVAVDLTFGDMPELAEAESFPLGKGPCVALGPNIHPLLYQRLVEVAKEEEIPYQIEPVPGRSGTDAWAIQVSREGVPTGLVSIPGRSMHTPVETISQKDLERTARLLASFIRGLDEELARKLGLGEGE